MKRILLLITCLAMHSAQSMQRPNLKAVGTPIPGAARVVTGAALLNLAWTLIKYARTPARIEAMVQTDDLPLHSEIQEQLTAQALVLAQVKDQQPTTAEATPSMSELQQAITALTAQLQQLNGQPQVTSADADGDVFHDAPETNSPDLVAEIATLREQIQQLPTQRTAEDAAGVSETSATDLLEQLRQQRAEHTTAATAQTAEIERLRTALEAPRPRGCHPCAAAVAGAAALPTLIIALKLLLPLFITPVFPS